MTVCQRLAAIALAGAVSPAVGQGIGSHLSVGTLAGDAAGLDDGYVHFGGFVPVAQPDDESLWYADGSLLLFHEGTEQLGANAGVGFRSLCEATGSILGGYVYYDRRDLGLDEFNQLGVGVESIGELFDARLNVNTPLSDAGAASLAFTTVDGEVGALLTDQGLAQLRGFVGVYGLFNDAVEETAGVRGRVELRLADQCFLGGYVEHDDVFETTGGFTLEYRYGRGPAAAEDSSSTLLARLGDRVNRRRHIVTAPAANLGVTTTGTSAPETETETEGGPGPLGPTDGPVEEPPGRPYRPPPRGGYAPPSA